MILSHMLGKFEKQKIRLKNIHKKFSMQESRRLAIIGMIWVANQ